MKEYNNWKCIHCGLAFRTRRLLQQHNLNTHKDLTKSKYAGDHNIQTTKCKFCDRTFNTSSGLTIHQKTCINNPNRTPRKGHSLSDETKKKISSKLKEYYKGTSIWATAKDCRKSYAEQYFDNCFPDAKQNYHVDRYFLDLAWSEKKVYFEVDGEQHYTKDGIEHDKERTKILENLGWILIGRVRWADFQKLSKEEKEKYIYEVKALVEACKPSKLDIRSGSILSSDKKTELEILRETRWNIIQQSNIDFSKFGWVKKISELFGISTNKAGNYIARNYPEFYEKCFVRK